MPWYSVHVEARAPEGTPGLDEETADQAAATLADVLAGHGFSGGVGSRSWTATISVEEDEADAAAIRGIAFATRGALSANLPPSWPIVRVDAVREDVLDEDLARPLWPDLVSAPEIADILGVSQSRVRLLAANNKRFPAPAYELRTGKIWLRSAIGRFAETWERKPGRPKAVPEATAGSDSPLVALDVFEMSVLRSDLPDADKLDTVRRHRDQAREYAESEAVEEPASKTPAE